MRELVIPWGEQVGRLRPPARHVLAVVAVPEEFVAWSQAGGMVVEGRIRIEGFYAGTDGRVHRLARVISLLHAQLAPPGSPGDLAGGASWWTEVSIPRVEAFLAGGDGRALRVEGEARVAVYEPPREGPVVAERRLLRVEEIVGEGETEFLETVELALDRPARQVVGAHGTVLGCGGQVVVDGVLASADVLVQLYYVDEDGVIRYQQGACRVERLVGASAAEAARARVSVHLASTEAEALPDAAVVRLRLLGRVRVQVLRTAELQLPTALGDTGGWEGARERVQVQEVLGHLRGEVLARAEHRLAVPASRLVHAVARILEVTVRPAPGLVVAEGFWQWEVLYADAAGDERFARGEEPFALSLPALRADEEAVALTESVGARLDASLGEDGVTIHLTATVTADVSLYRQTVADVITAVPPSPGGVKTRTLDVERLVGQAAGRSLLEKKGVLVTRGFAVTAVASRVEEVAWEIIPDQVLVRGVLREQIFYVDRNKVHRYQTEGFPVSLLLDVPGASPGMDAVVTVAVRHVSLSLAPDERTFYQRIVLDAACRVTERRQLTVVTGLGTPERSVAFTVRGTLPLPRRWRRAEVRGRAAVVHLALAARGPRPFLEGILRLDLFAAGSPLCWVARVPFSAEADLGPPAGAGLRAAVDRVTCRLEARRAPLLEWTVVARAWWAT